MKTRLVSRTVACIVLGAIVTMLGFAQSDSTIVRSDSLSTGEAIARTIPPVVLNVAPGFGLGSYLQGDTRDALWLTGADLVSAGLLTVGLVGLSQYPDEDEGGWAALTLLAGYATLLGSKVAAVAIPVAEHRRHGVAAESIFAPIFYNMVPGIGLGSLLQGDERGANVIALLDATAVGSIGVLSFAALGGMEVLTAISGIAAYGSYAAARIIGVIRPIRFEAATARRTAS